MRLSDRDFSAVLEALDRPARVNARLLAMLRKGRNRMHVESPAADQYSGCVLEIEWTGPDLPRLVGPFVDPSEAEEWALTNIVDGEWAVSPMTDPNRHE